MAANRIVIRRPILGVFEVVHVPGKDYAEIDSKFLEEFEDELGDTLNFLDHSGNSHNVTFNRDYAYPLFTEGWSTLKEFYNLEGQKQVFLNYLGRNQFLLILGKTYRGFHQFPSYHSLSTNKHGSVFFEITLEDLDFAEPHQLVLNRDLKEFLWQYDFDHLVLCGKLGNPRTTCEVRFHRDDGVVIATLGQRWEPFCIENEFESGDTIRFKLFDGPFSHYVHVFKVDE